MLKQISSISFIEAMTLVTAVYYLMVALLFYRSEMQRFVANNLLKRPGRKGQGETPM